MRSTKLLIFLAVTLAGVGAWAIDVFFVPDNTNIQVVDTNVIYSTSFMTQPAKAYQIQIQQGDSMTSTNWTNVFITIGGPVSSGGTVTWSYTNWGAALLPQQFYRLRVRLLP